MTGYPAESFLSGEVEYGELIVAEDRQKVWEAVQAAVRLGEAYTLSYGIRTAAGERRWVWEQGQGVWDENDELEALEGFITDVTEKRELERQFLRAQRMEGIGQIAGGVAHDLNNALAPIVMTVRMSNWTVMPGVICSPRPVVVSAGELWVRKSALPKSIPFRGMPG